MVRTTAREGVNQLAEGLSGQEQAQSALEWMPEWLPEWAAQVLAEFLTGF